MKQHRFRVTLWLFLFLSTLVSPSWAEFISETQARNAAISWVNSDGAAIDHEIGRQIGSIVSYTGGTAGDVGYFLVLLEPSGWVVIPKDDRFWPVAAFGSGKMTPALFEESFFKKIISFSTPSSPVVAGNRASITKNLAQNRWKQLQKNTYSALENMRGDSPPSNAKTWVSPLLKTRWSQYGDHTKLISALQLITSADMLNDPKLSEIFKKPGDIKDLRYGAGDLPVAMGQLMNFFLRDKYSGVGVGITSKNMARNYSIRVNLPDYNFEGIINQKRLESQYQWAKMPDAPAGGSEYLSPLLRDLGVAAQSYYQPENTDGNPEKMAETFLDFGFVNAIGIYKTGRSITKEDVRNAINSNLDLGHPALALIANPRTPIESPPYSVVVDGYAVEISEEDNEVKLIYYHLNGVLPKSGMGNNAQGWALEFNPGLLAEGEVTGSGSISGVLFNVFPSQPNGLAHPEVLSGRVILNESLTSFDGLTVRVYYDGVPKRTLPLDSKGMYTTLVPADTKITLELLKDNEPLDLSEKIELEPAISSSTAGTIASKWGLNFTAQSDDIVGVLSWLNTDTTKTLKDLAIKYRDILIETVNSSSDTDWKETKLLCVPGELQFDYDVYPVPYLAIAQIKRFAENGGIVLVTERASNLMNVLGKDVNLKVLQGGTLNAYGSLPQLNNTVAGVDFRNYLGTRELVLRYSMPPKEHSIIDLVGDAQMRTLGHYVISRLDYDDTWQTFLEYYPTAVSFPVGSKGGHVLFTNYSFDENQLNNGALGKKIVRYYLSELFEKTGHPDKLLRNAKAPTRFTQQNVRTGKQMRGNSGVFEVFGFDLDLGRTEISTRRKSTNEGDSLVMDATIISNDVEIWREKQHIVVAVKGSPAKLVVKNWYADELNKLREMAFADGTTWTAEKMEKMAANREPDINVTPISTDHKVRGTEGNDTLEGIPGKNNFFVPGAGDDLIVCSSGSNVYFYTGGNDIIQNSTQPGNRNVLRFASKITSADVTGNRQGDDLRLQIATGGSVTFRDWYKDEMVPVDRAEFFDGTIWDYLDLEKLANGKQLTLRGTYLESAENIDLSKWQSGGQSSQTQGEAGGGGCNAPALSLWGLLLAGLVTATIKRRA